MSAVLAAPIATLVQWLPDYPLADLFPPVPDIRDRGQPEYRTFFEQLVADIAERGVQQPVSAFIDGNVNRILDGWTRCLASRMAGKNTIPVLLHPHKPEGKERLLGSLQSNAMRLDMDDMEYGVVYVQLMEEGGIETQSELASVVKASPSLVSKRLRQFARIPQDIRSNFGRGPRKLGGRAAYAISRLLTDDDKREITRIAVERELKVEAIEHWVAARLGKKCKRAKPTKLVCGGATITLTGNLLECLRTVVAKGGEALKRFEKDPAMPVEMLPALLK